MTVYDEKQIALLHAAIHAVASDGLEKTTTRSIGATAKINDAYIYRYFRDKEDLLSQAYIFVNEQLISLASKTIREVEAGPEPDPERRFAAVIHRLWDDLIDRSDVCMFCNYYYHSASYKKYADEQHRRLVRGMLDTLSQTYTVSPQAEVAIYYLMESILGFTAKVIDGVCADSEEYFNMAVARLYPIFRSAAAPKES